MPNYLPDAADLEHAYSLKVRNVSTAGFGPRTCRRFGYYGPDDYYEALMLRLVTADTSWLDVGCGRAIFPSNPRLAKLLADRARLLVGVDPDETLDENPFVHERVRSEFESYNGEHRFDLVTLRMVAEHVTNPGAVLDSIRRAIKPGGLVVIYTVNRFSPVPIITHFTPFSLHHVAKRILWNTETKDTFPTAFRMNTRKRLRELFEGHGFKEEGFARLDDCRTLSGFRAGLWLELAAWKTLRAAGIGYPEACLLGLYRL